MTAKKIASLNAQIASKLAALDASESAYAAAQREASAATVAEHGTIEQADDAGAEALDAWCAVEAAHLERLGAGVARAACVVITREIMALGRELAIAVARKARRTCPADVLAMYDRGLRGDLTLPQIARVLNFHREAATKTIV